jgi:septum site-determining protein MinC
VASARALLEGLRAAGVLPVALAYGTREIEELSVALGLPLLAKFRAQYERAEDAPAAAGVGPATHGRGRDLTSPPKGRRPNGACDAVRMANPA